MQKPTIALLVASLLSSPAAQASGFAGTPLFDGAGAPVSLDAAGLDVPAVDGAPVGDGDTAADVSPAPYEWTEEDVAGGVSDANPSGVEKKGFMAQAFYQLCRNAKVKFQQGFSPDPFKVQVKFNRHFVKIPGVGVAIADEGRARFSLRDHLSLGTLGEHAGVRVGLGAEHDGTFVVVRPLKDQNTCHQLDRLLDVSDIKPAVFESRRMAKMRVEELWKMSVRLRTPVSVGVGYGRPGLSAGVSFGYHRQGEANVTLRRLSPEFLRLRLRVDRADVFSLNGSARAQIKGTDFGDETKDLLGDIFPVVGDKLLYNELNKALQAKLRLIQRWSKSQEGLIEFILDPEDEAQMKALERLLTGDVDVLDTLGKLTELAGKAYANRLRVARTAGRWSEKLGVEPAFVGIDRKTDSRAGLHLKVPLLLELKGAGGKARDKIVILDENGGELRIYSAGSESRVSFLKLPVAGALVESGSRRSVMSFGGRDKEGDIQNVAVYVQQERFRRAGGLVARAMVAEAGEIMRYAGVRGRGVSDVRLPVSLAFAEGADPAQEVVKEGAAAFTLILNEDAVASLRAAPAGDVYKAYVNTLADSDYRAELEWVLANGKIGRDGLMSYDARALARAFRADDDTQAAVDAHLEDASVIAYELRTMGVRQEGRRRGVERSSGGRAEDLRDVMAGYSRGALGDVLAGRPHGRIGYDQKMKVLVQLVEREDVSAEVCLMVDKDGKGKKDILKRYVINPGAADTESLRRMTQTLNRFRPASKYSD